MTTFDQALARYSRPQPQCTVAKARAQMSETDAAALDAALAHSLTPGEAIAQAIMMVVDDLRISGNTVQRHRHGRCNCGRTA